MSAASQFALGKDAIHTTVQSVQRLILWRKYSGFWVRELSSRTTSRTFANSLRTACSLRFANTCEQLVRDQFRTSSRTIPNSSRTFFKDLLGILFGIFRFFTKSSAIDCKTFRNFKVFYYIYVFWVTNWLICLDELFANFRTVREHIVRKATRTVPNYEFGKLRELGSEIFPNRVREQKLPNSEPWVIT